jgi:hypothetical protein
VVLTLGEPAAECVGPLLWHVSLPRDSLDRGCILLEAVRSVIAQASRTRDEAAVARLALERLTAEQTQRSDDYHRVADALHGQVALLAASVVAGLLWEYAGPAWTFAAGALFSLLAMLALLGRREQR